MPLVFNLFPILGFFQKQEKEDDGIRISFEEARLYLFGLWQREPTTDEVLDYQNYMMSN